MTINRRPLSITIIGWLFMAAGTVGLVYHASEFNLQRPFDSEPLVACLVRLLAIVGGAFMLGGRNWARWLLTVWMVIHIVLSAFHSAAELAMHLLLFGIIGYLLFRPPAAAWLRGTSGRVPASSISEDNPTLR